MQPYRIPFHFDRTRAPHYRLHNRGPEPVRGVTVALLGSGIMPAGPPRRLLPGEVLELVIRGDDLARETALVIRWIRPDGDEYLWRVAF